MNFIIEKPIFRDLVYNVLDFGAKSELGFNNKLAFQKAIDKCSNDGGGVVLVPNGYYLTGPIEIKSNVNFHLDNNAFIQFNKSKEDYPLIWTDYEGQKRIRTISPISINGACNVAITGNGVIDGSGDLWRGIKKWKLTTKEWERCLAKSNFIVETKETSIWYPSKSVYEGVMSGEPDYNDPKALEKAAIHYDMYRPVLLSIKNCDRVLIEGITIQNSPAWNIHPWFCKNLTVNNVKVKNKFSAQNGDGIDIESCENCEIANSIFEVGDDGICVKSGKNAVARQTYGPCKNIYIHDCKVFDAHGGFVVGSEMSRGVENIFVENCTFIGTDIGVRFKSALGRGGVVKDIFIKNISMANIIEEAIIFTMGYELHNLESLKVEKGVKNCKEDIPEFKDIHLDNIICNGAKKGIVIKGLEELPIHDLHFNNMSIRCCKDLELSNCKNIYFNNAVIILEEEQKTINERIEA